MALWDREGLPVACGAISLAGAGPLPASVHLSPGNLERIPMKRSDIHTLGC